MSVFAASLVFFTLIAQQASSPADFERVSGASLKTRYDSAVREGRSGNTDLFWIAYQFPVRSGVTITGKGEGINVHRNRTSDGIEFVDTAATAQRVGLFLLMRKSDGGIEKTRILNLDENFRVHDRRVYWLAEPNAEESVALLTTLVGGNPQSVSSALLMTVGLHPDPVAADNLLRIARTSTSTEVKKNAIFWLGQEVSRQSGEELEKLAKDDPEVEVQKQAVFALSQRNNDEAINSLVRIAKDHPSLAVRKQAIYWLGQKRDSRVIDFYEQMLKK